MLTAASLVATFVAGLASFFAPCTVPLLPAYLATVSGVTSAGTSASGRGIDVRARLVLGSVLYVLGFATVFVLLGIGAGGIGHSVRVVARPLEVAGGVVLVLFGLLVLDVIHVPVLARVRALRLPTHLGGRGVTSAYLVGVVFGIGWTPCVGPLLGTALVFAGTSAHVLTGAVLLGVYAVGLGLPFIAVALFVSSMPSLPARARALSRPFTIAAGAVTIGLGVLLATGWYAHLTSYLAQLSTPS
ncbi:MAG: cytochrome c biogenesis CcdA family protein [Candidatus Dormibacteria bacterium]